MYSLPLSLRKESGRLPYRFSCPVIFFPGLHFTIDPLLVLIEYVPFGDLLGYLRKSRGLNDTYFKDPDAKPQTNLTAEQLIRFAWQVADGMFYLSSRKVWLLLLFFLLQFFNSENTSFLHWPFGVLQSLAI